MIGVSLSPSAVSLLLSNNSLHPVHPPLLSLGPPLFRSSPPLHSSFSSPRSFFHLFFCSCFDVLNSPCSPLKLYSISVTLAVPRSFTQASSIFLHLLHAYVFSPVLLFFPSGFHLCVSFLQTTFDLSHPFHALHLAFHNPAQSLSSVFTPFLPSGVIPPSRLHHFAPLSLSLHVHIARPPRPSYINPPTYHTLTRFPL